MNLINLMNYDPELFSGVVLPDGMEAADIVNAIQMECATLTPVYSDPSLFKQMIGHYFKSRLQIHQKLWDTLSLEYDPISNYDRQEISTRNTSSTSSGVNTGSGNSTNINEISPFNASGYTPDSKATNSSSTTASNSDQSTGTDRYTSHVYGNIGVTTSQQMIESERAVSRFDIYREIAADFSKTFFIQIY